MSWGDAWGSKDAYKIGKGRPPQKNQFKPGQSGNPKGRKRADKKLGDTLQNILSEQVTVREGDKVSKMRKSEAMLHSIVVKAMKGDAQAQRTLLSLVREHGQFAPDFKYNATGRMDR